MVDQNEWTEELLTDQFSLDTFVPLSEVRHTAPPGWVSRANCTLPPKPIGKAENIKLRSSGGGFNNEKPRETTLALLAHKLNHLNRESGPTSLTNVDILYK